MFGKKDDKDDNITVVGINGETYSCAIDSACAIDALSRTKVDIGALSQIERDIDDHEKALGGLQADISILDAKIESIPDTVECERCGCLLRKRTAIRGESVIERSSGFSTAYSKVILGIDVPTKETIRERYYCKVHAPKAKK